jgi:hypothetical protein
MTALIRKEVTEINQKQLADRKEQREMERGPASSSWSSIGLFSRGGQ